jgi:hypothetical protein
MDSLEHHERVLAVSRLVDKWADDALGDEPDWGPLSRVLPSSWCGGSDPPDVDEAEEAMLSIAAGEVDEA